MKSFATIILAAGEGKRMQSPLPKVCHLVAGQPIISYPVRLARELKGHPIVVVLSGNQERSKLVRECLHHCFPNGLKSNLSFAIQNKPLGTGDAVVAAKKALSRFQGTILVLNGDVPLLKKNTVANLLKDHWQKKADLSLTSTIFVNPKGYGRMIRDSSNQFLRIVEEREATPIQKKIKEINAGIYAIESSFLFSALPLMKRNNQQKEYYLTDLAQIAIEQEKKVYVHLVKDGKELMGINTQEERMEVERVAKKQKIKELIANGVNIIDPETTYVDSSVKISSGAIIHPGCSLLGNTQIGKNAELGPYVIVENSKIGSESKIKPFSVLEQAKLESKTEVGPFAHLRPGAVLKDEAKVGNFVELKKTVMGKKSKANHLSYLGDSFIGEKSNIGAGTIMCNYDGFEKHVTQIGKEVFVGSDVQFVAPVKVGEGALIAAGTTVTKDVPAGSLAISRTKQENKKDWAKKRNQHLRKKKLKKRS